LRHISSLGYQNSEPDSHLDFRLEKNTNNTAEQTWRFSMKSWPSLCLVERSFSMSQSWQCITRRRKDYGSRPSRFQGGRYHELQSQKFWKVQRKTMSGIDIFSHQNRKESRYCDLCSAQNKNPTMIVALLTYINFVRTAFKEVKVVFSICGQNQASGTIEK